MVCLASLLLSCASTPQPLEGSVQQRINETLAEVEPHGRASSGVDVPADVMQALLPPMSVPAVKRDMVSDEKRFDISAKDAPAREVFIGLAQGTPYSIVVAPDLEGSVSINLKNVSFMEALNTIRDVHGYSFEREGNRIKVFGKGLRTRIFSVNYLNLIRKGTSGTSAAAADLSKSNSGTRGVSVTTTTESDFWKQLKDTLDVLIGKADGRAVVVNPQSSMVIIRATSQELELVQAYLGQTHDTVNRQVMLEAKIVEVELSDGFRQGINWAAVNHPTDGSRIIASQVGGGTTLSGTNTSEIAGSGMRLDPENFISADSTVASTFGGVFALALQTSDFTAFLELLKRQGSVHVLSSPRVSTVNNQKALIKIGGDEYYPTGVKNNQNSGDSNRGTQVEVTLEAFFSGIALDVTPQIDADGNVQLHIHPTISEVTESTKSFVVAGGNFILPTALSTVRESDNVVRATSGQIVVIGGLMQEVAVENVASVPILGDLPLIGGLFQHKQVSRVKKELVILIKPTILNGQEEWRNVTKEARDRFLDIAEVPKR